MRRGAVLYRDIWDNKTPLLYFIYALSPTLLWAKLSATLCVLGTVLGVYKLSRNLVATTLAGVLLSLTVLEGNIANAELYFTLPIVWGAYLISQGRWFLVTGLLAAMAFLLKVPAVLDFAGLFLAAAVIKLDRTLIKNCFLMALGFALPVGLVFGYFSANHALADFITAAFSQNASYIAIDTGPLSKLSNPLFVRAFILVPSLIFIAILYLKKHVSKEFIFLSFWLSFSLYGALLSNRPYLHYLLQIVPPTIILLAHIVPRVRKYWPAVIVFGGLLFALGKMFAGGFALDPATYYRNFFDFISERKSWKSYVSYFDNRTPLYYAMGDLVREKTKPDEPIFVWGDAASIYVLAERPAATKFIQAHHLTTIDKKNYDLIMARLQKFQPKFIFISRPVQFPFSALESLVAKNYRPVATFGNFYAYQNFAPASPQKWNPNY